ncbi:MAG: hypothetical protein ACRDRI_09845 [Pseudonocardiaceae bacterium]
MVREATVDARQSTLDGYNPLEVKIAPDETIASTRGTSRRNRPREERRTYMMDMNLPTGGGVQPGAPPTSEQMLANIRANQDTVLSNATRAALEIAENFVPALAAVRRILPIDDVELISSQLPKYVRKRSTLPHDLQERVAQDALDMRDTLANLIEQTAQWIEYYEYADAEHASPTPRSQPEQSRSQADIRRESTPRVSSVSAHDDRTIREDERKSPAATPPESEPLP